MPTFGRPETAVDHPPLAERKRLDDVYAAYLDDVRKMFVNCNHHYTPVLESHALRESNVHGVFSLGRLLDTDPLTSQEVWFYLRCSRCGRESHVNAACHCPKCGHKVHEVPLPTKSDAGGDSRYWQKKYFGSGDGYMQVLMFACTDAACDYRAVGLLWDQ